MGAFALVTALVVTPAHADTRTRVDALQKQLDRMATSLRGAQAALGHTHSMMRATQAGVKAARRRLERARASIAVLARRLYIEGPGSVAEVIFGAQSFEELSGRLRFTGTLQAYQRGVVDGFAIERRRLLDRQRDLARVEDRQAALVRRLAQQRIRLEELFRRQSSLLRTSRTSSASRAAPSSISLVRGAGPLEVCPVDRPRAYSNDFGDPRGGGRTHQGIDILAPRGTPVRAPFSGRVERRNHALSGLAFRLYGKGGYAFGAHLNSYGANGSVSAGTIIGYVGNTGNASGGPTHLHFEWHPGGGGAVNPYRYLNQVC